LSDKKERVCEFYPEVRECSYDATKSAKFRYFIVENCSNSLYHMILERGWRRFGRYFFVPVCETCDACITIRYIVDEFMMSKNHKRVKKINQDIEITLSRPAINYERLELYNEYHLHMNIKKGWDYIPINPKTYNEMFVEGYEGFGYEMSFRLGGELVGVALLDILPNALSSVYFFYKPALLKRSLGTFSILKQIEIAKAYGIPYIYPGYWIKDHKSMGYKERFRPFEVLVNRPDIDEKTIWGRYE